MTIGVAKENREKSEKRVILLPAKVRILIKDGHTVKMEQGVGVKIGISDEDYKKAGAIITSRKEVYSSDIVLRIQSPTIEELELIKPRSILACMIHRDTHPEMVKEFKRRKIFVIELNEIRDKDGGRLVEAFEIAGREGIKAGFKLFQEIYNKNPENVVIMGYGNLATPAIQTASRMGAVVKVLGRLQTSKGNIRKNLRNAEIIVNATYRFPSEIGKYLITKDDLLLLNKKSLVLDLSADPISCIQTCHPTTLDNPSYFVKIGQRKIPHMCIYSLPGLKPSECSRRYSEQLIPFIKLIANSGLQEALKKSPDLKRALISG